MIGKWGVSIVFAYRMLVYFAVWIHSLLFVSWMTSEELSCDSTIKIGFIRFIIKKNSY